MAWTCSGSTNKELLVKMRSAGLIKSNAVFNAMNRVDRANYVVTASLQHAYSDAPQTIGFGATVSAPHMHALATEALLPYLRPGNRVLDVGSGSGYTMAIFWHLVKAGENINGSDGKQVVGIDHIPQLVAMADANLRKDGLDGALDKGNIETHLGDGRLGE
jgi:protein-L-isoaspartate(D-aspartate) O-methyltransferase